MSHSTELRAVVEKWTTEEVHHWLTTEVQIHHEYADKLLGEDVSGVYLLCFEKKDLLDMEIKHGPAVKITSYLENLTKGSKPESQSPSYVEKWTKEQVYQWLLQYVKIASKYAKRVQEEEVSGDCLVFFKKQDFLDLDIKGGPVVKIMLELRNLKSRPEPMFKSSHTDTVHVDSQQTNTVSEDSKNNNTVQEDSQKCVENQPRTNCSQALSSKQPESPTKGELIKYESYMVQSSKEKPPQKEMPKPQVLGAERIHSEVIQTLLCPPTSLQKTLEHLDREGMRKFRFHLKHFDSPIACSRLEDKGSVDIADLMTQHYGREEALQVTLKILDKMHCRDLGCRLKRDIGQLEQPCNSKELLKREANQGDKLKNLLTCGGNSLDHYDQFVVVMNKNSPKQAEDLQFLNKLKLFCVLDFDPSSAAPGGVCHFYRESRVANLHTPTQFQGETETVIKNLNLYKQTSWVFCNGRHDLDSESNRELDYKNWLRRACKDIEHLVSFICKPDVLINGRTLIIFLLLSPVHNEKDPIFDTYKAFYKHKEEESIISICESPRTFEKWRDLIESKCESNITRESIYELTLSEVNGTIMALGPFNQTSGRLIPSSDSSFVILKQKDEDYMTALDILCQNQCENVYEETSAEFHNFKIKVEEEFFRGGKVKWWNFYFCEKSKMKPFIRRDRYSNLKKMISSQTKDPKTACVLLNLFHHPGCGGTTLAMHVMWDLRRDFRCAVLKDHTVPTEEVAIQVRKLMKLESGQSTPVLLLVDDSKEAENTKNLVDCIRKAIVDDHSSRPVEDSPSAQVIVLNCVRSHNPKEQYKHSTTERQYITALLTQKEQDDFEEKLQELRETHTKPENFYSFMIMKSNFDKNYIAGLVRNTLENLDMSTKKAQLLAFLALLNTYAAESEISISLSEDFLGMKMIRWLEVSVLDNMEPYSNLLIIDKVEERGGYRGIRILHHSIASACLEELETSYHFKVSEITMSMLQCDLFFKTGVVKDALMRSIERMLIERQRKKDGDERQQFSPLIEKIHTQEGRQTIQDIFVKASSHFVTSASIPQALARYLYIKAGDFPEALKWAEKAKKIKENPFTVDTIGQVYKSNLKCNTQSEKHMTPEDLDSKIKSSNYGIKAFQRAQELAEDEPEEDKPDDYPTKSPYNIYGYMGVLEIAFLLFDILSRLPFFDEADPMKKRYMQSFLKGTIPITSVYKDDNEINQKYVEILKKHEPFLRTLKTSIKNTFEFFDCYFTYIKGNNLGKSELKNHSTIYDHFKKYVQLFCSSPEEIRREQMSNPKLNLKMDIEERRVFLVEWHADTFAGILQHLDKPAVEMERITEYYAFLQPHCINQKQKTKEQINYILSNIILHHLNPQSKHVKSHKELSALLLRVLQDVGLHYSFPDPYYLALLLFWPSRSTSPSTSPSTEIRSYVNAIRKSSHRHLAFYFRKRNTVAHFYLGKQDGLGRLVPKPKLDECFPKIPRNTLAQLWQNGDIFKEKEINNRLLRVIGTIESGEVFANYHTIKIPVRPAFLGGIRSGFSTEKVSFYLGFAIDGPLAYDIQYDD